MTKAKIIDMTLRAVCLVVGLCLFFWWSNRQVAKRVAAECELKSAQQTIIKTEVKQKEIENVAKSKAVIYSRPNAKRDSLLSSMRNGTL